MCRTGDVKRPTGLILSPGCVQIIQSINSVQSVFTDTEYKDFDWLTHHSHLLLQCIENH